MTEFSNLLIILLFIFTILLSSKFFYIGELKIFARRISSLYGLDIINLDFSFEQMVYFVSLPSHSPIMKNVELSDIHIEYDYTSLFLPELSGIQVYINVESEKMLIAYLATKDFRVPKLDQMQEQRKINSTGYLKISSYKLVNQKTIKEITNEVYNQIHSGKLNK